MAIKIVPADITVCNPQLAALAARKYTNSYTAVPNSKLPAAVRDPLAVIFAALSGQELQLDASTIAISSRDNVFYRCYAPKLYRGGVSEDGTKTPDLYIRWGNDRIAVEVVDGMLQPAYKSGDKTAFKFCTFNPSGRGEDPGLEIKVTVKDGKDSNVYVTTIALAPEDWANYSADLFNTTLENDADEFTKLLSQESQGGGGGTRGDVTDRKSILTALFGSPDDQTHDVQFVVTGYRNVKTSYGETYILQCSPTDIADIAQRVPVVAAEFGLWADGSCRRSLSAEPEISEANPATVLFPRGGMSVLLLPQTAAIAGGLDLNFD